jgi:NAD(P)-dependent dehydrogenase (short-subunit alcohol dehydrogenase family)
MKSNVMFENKTAVITGAGGTLCSAIAKDLASRGAQVALLGRTLASLESVAREIENAGGRAVAIVCDVTQSPDIEEACLQIIALWGGIDILINGAGGKIKGSMTATTAYTQAELEGGSHGFFSLDRQAIQQEIDLNIIGTILPSQIFGKQIALRGGGSIINFGSMNSYRPLSKVPGYALAKEGVVNFTQWLACYLAPAKIRVNAVAPGFFLNERSRKLLLTEEGGFSERGQQVIRHTPMGRFGEAHEICGAVRWLLDEEAASYVTGICIPVDGGFLAEAGV